MYKQGPCSIPQGPAGDLGTSEGKGAGEVPRCPDKPQQQPAIVKRGPSGSLQPLPIHEAPWDKRGSPGLGPAVPHSVEGRVCGSLLVRQGVQVGRVHGSEDNIVTNTVTSPKGQFWLLPEGGASGKPGRASGVSRAGPWCPLGSVFVLERTRAWASRVLKNEWADEGGTKEKRAG